MRVLNSEQERAEVVRIMKATEDKPEERERQLTRLARDHAICPGVVCRCEPGKCPRHGTVG